MLPAYTVQEVEFALQIYKECMATHIYLHNETCYFLSLNMFPQ